MKRSLLSIYFVLSLLIGITQTQTITFAFQAEDAQTNNSIALQSVFIKNLTMDCDTIIYGANPSITLSYFVGIDETKIGKAEAFTVVSTMPNPFIESTFVNINLNKKGNLYLFITNGQGKRIADFSKDLPVGLHKFEITGSNHNLIILNVSYGTFSKSIKLLNHSSGADIAGIRYVGTDMGRLHKTQPLDETSGFIYNLGDQMLFTANANGYNEETITAAPVQSTDYTFEMTPLQLVDGYYVKGSTTACPELNLNGLMTIARNEVVQEDREELKELYMAVEEGGNGFIIVEVNGSSSTTYGPGNDFAFVTEPDPDEPTAGLWRGSIVETNEKFVVPEDGLYHIAFDEEIMIAVIAKVEWGIIGSATPGGWGSSTVLPSTGFNLNTMSFEASNIVMNQFEWKFRYSDGWKVILDPYYDLGNGNFGIKVNSNFGGAIDNLVPGGYNLNIEEQGFYTITLMWDLGNVYQASLLKTGDLPTTDYTDTELGFVGDGLMVNGVQHNWIETIMLHVPIVQNETNYTWTYSDVEVTTLGSFKIREGQTWENLVLGYYDVAMAGSAASDFEGNNDGNFVPIVDGNYDFELFIDAVTEEYIFTVNLTGEAPKLWVPGEYQGWDPLNAPILEDADEDGVFEGTVDFSTGTAPFEFKFTSQPDWNGTNYGSGDNAGELSTDGGAGNLTVPEAGTYLLTADINNLTWTYELQ